MQAQEVDPVLTCEGPISRQASHASLAKEFGARNVSVATLSLGEGETERGTVLFAADPARRIAILWSDSRKRSRPRMVIFGRSPAGAEDPAAYRWRIAARPQAKPLHLRQPLGEVEAINGRPFELTGFGWDYSGTVTDWRGGALDAPPGGCRILLRFEAGKEASGLAQDAVSGDQGFNSDDPKMRAVSPVVYEMSFIWDYRVEQIAPARARRS